MDRREVLQLGAAAIAMGAVAKPAIAQTSGWKNSVDAYSRTMHWVRTPEEVAQVCHEVGNVSIDLTVRSATQGSAAGHVLPEKAKADLVPFINGLKRNGITVHMIAMEVADANTPYLEDMLAAASSVGVHHTWWRGLTFDPALPYPKALDALKPRVEALAKVLAKYQFKACYHPGGDFTQLLDLCRPFDPKNISIQYDTGNFGQFNQGTLATQIRTAGPYVGAFVFKDFYIEKLTPEQITARGAGRGGRGGGGSPNGFSSRQVPVGTGVLNLPVICQALKEINFQGPIECQPEWPELGGPNQGLDKLSIPRAEVIRLLKRDFDTVSAPLKEAGVI
jgi:sugar phosphate isomerase/epimerase